MKKNRIEGLLVMTIIAAIVINSSATTEMGCRNNIDNEKILFVCDGSELSFLQDHVGAILQKDDNGGCGGCLTPSDIVCVTLDNVPDLSFFSIIALPAEVTYGKLAKEAISKGMTVCLYGSVTIDKYKRITGQHSFSTVSDLCDLNGKRIGVIECELDPEHEKKEVYSVISNGDSPLLCKLEKENEEIDPYYDYFAIKTNTWLTSSIQNKTVSEIKTKYCFPASFDDSELIETAPCSQSNIGVLSGTVGFGSQTTGTVGFSVDLSDQRPNITRSENFTNDTVEWIMTPAWFRTLNVNGARLPGLASWAAAECFGYTGIDIYYGGAMKMGNWGSISAPYTKVPIRMHY